MATRAPILSELAALLVPDDAGNIALVQSPLTFSNDKNLATTEFVQNALGNFQDFSGFVDGGAPALTGVDAGKIIVVSGMTPGTLYLPPIDLVPSGTAFCIKAESSAWTISAAGVDGDAIVYGNGGHANIPLAQDDFIIFARGGSLWRTYGTGVLKYGASFAHSLLGQGYHKLPSGWTIQWGTGAAGITATPVVYPIAFPNAVYSVMITSAQYSPIAVSAFNASFTGFSAVAAADATPIAWMAIGT